MVSNVYSAFERTVDEGLDDFLKENEAAKQEQAAKTAEGRMPEPARVLEIRIPQSEGETKSAPHITNRWTVLVRDINTVGPFMMADVLSLACSGLMSYTVLRLFGVVGMEKLFATAPVMLFPLLLVYIYAGLYTEIWIHPILELRSLAHINGLCIVCAAAGVSSSPAHTWFLLTALPMILFAVPLARSITRHLLARFSAWGFPTIVIGSGEEANVLAESLASHPRSGLRPVIVSDPGNECKVSRISVINDPEQLASVIRTESVRHAVVSLPNYSAAQLADLLDRYGAMLPHVLLLCDAPTMPSLWGASRRCGRLTGIEVRNGLLLSTLGFVKRSLDLFVACTVLVLGSPLFALLYTIVKFTSKGPVFFGHTRIGQHGKPFKAWKFRSMYQNSAPLLDDLLAKDPEARAEWDRDQKLKNDPRVTPIGNILRKFSLDELPQLWNVFTGDMSLVGPRPIVQNEVIKYGQVFRQYTSVKPGITGLWQVSGRNDIGYDERVQLDQFYVRHWSPWMDLYILGRTVITLICGKGAY